jgi:hypothetical protein
MLVEQQTAEVNRAPITDPIYRGYIFPETPVLVLLWSDHRQFPTNLRIE